MTNNPLQELYLEWLYNQINFQNGQKSSKTFWSLIRILNNTEFVWTLPNDDNRVADGLDLRHEFINEISDTTVDGQLGGGASVLEVLIGLSRRLGFMTSGMAPGWAWHLIENLGFNKMYDQLNNVQRKKITQTLDNLIWHKYEPNGHGGFFPLAWSNQDQREVELWYQMSAYVDEIVEL